MVVDVGEERGFIEILHERRDGENGIEGNRPAGYLGIAGPGVERPAIVGIENQSSSCRRIFQVIDVRASVLEDIRIHARRIAIAGRQAAPHGITERAGYTRRSAFEICITSTDRYASLELVAGFLRRDQDRAGNRVAAVKRALRTFQDFDLLHIHEFFVETVGIRAQYAVDNVGKRGFGVARRHDTADAHLGITDVGGIDDSDVRHQRDEVHRSLDASPFDRLLGKCRDRDRNLLQTFRAFACRDDDLLDAGSTFLGQNGPGRQNGQPEQRYQVFRQGFH